MNPKEYSMKNIAPTVATILKITAPNQSTGFPIKEIVNDLSDRKKIAILAPDALGAFAWNLWKDEMPYLKILHTQRSLLLRSVMPSMTPVNFTTMVTGNDQSEHKVGSFNDDIKCESLFDVIKISGGKSAGIGLYGYTGSELLGRHADICGNAGKGTDDDVADKTIEIANDYQPEFIISQLGIVDDVFHRFGPSSKEVVPMLRETDNYLKKITESLKPLGYGIIILADHGQHDVPENPDPYYNGDHGSDSDKDCLVPCTWI